MESLNAIIIDDEESARETLSGLIKKYAGEVNILAEADTVDSGLEVLKKNKADITFMDVRMASGTSFEILEKLEEIDFEIIFTTAYDRYALKAIKFSALDYLLKPINPTELVSAIEKVKRKKFDKLSEYKHAQKLKVLSENRNGTNNEFSKIALPSPNGLMVTELKNIVRCEGYKNYTTFYLEDKKRVVVSKTLKEFEDMLDSHGFVRIFQSHLVNLDHIKNYLKGRGGHVEMSDGSCLPVSREKKAVLMDQLKTIF